MEHAGCATALIMLDSSYHSARAHFCACAYGARDVGDKDRTLGVRCTAVVTEPAIDARRTVFVRRAQGGNRRGRNRDAEPCATTDEHLSRSVQFVLTLRVAL